MGFARSPMNDEQKALVEDLAQQCERRLIDARHNPSGIAAAYSLSIARMASDEAFRIAQEAR